MRNSTDVSILMWCWCAHCIFKIKTFKSGVIVAWIYWCWLKCPMYHMWIKCSARDAFNNYTNYIYLYIKMGKGGGEFEVDLTCKYTNLAHFWLNTISLILAYLSDHLSGCLTVTNQKAWPSHQTKWKLEYSNYLGETKMIYQPFECKRRKITSPNTCMTSIKF